nr:RNA-directed DNA polymerase, eukaryota [Tanacetum cinerariifolium]
MEHVGVASWFTNLTYAHSDFVARDRIVWVDIEGVPLHAWSHKTFNKIGSKWGEVMNLEESTDDMFARKRICIKTKKEDNILEKFKIIVRGKIFIARAKELFSWSPNFKSINDHVYCSDEEPIVYGDIADKANKGDATKTANSNVDSDDEGVADTMFGDNDDNLDVNQGNDKPGDHEVSSDPFSVYNLLNKQDAAKKGVQTNTNLDKSLSHPLGFTHEKEAHANNDQEIDRSVNNKDCHAVLGMNTVESKMSSGDINSRVANDTQNVDDYSSPVTNNYANVGRSGGSIIDILDDMIKVGNTMGYSLDGASDPRPKKIGLGILIMRISEALGYSGGILCVWDSSSFHKEHHTISDNFHDAAKRVLWDYVSSIINRWDGDTIVMGDFNKIRNMGERMGSVFNSRGASEFNSFIDNSGLVEVQLEGFSFTWSHPSAKKISKLDPFLVSEGFTSLFPRTSAICLDKHLSDHRPILLREAITDYGASLFRFYHSWFKLNGFDDMVSNTWQSIMLDDSNAMIRFKKKLQCMKKAIRSWVTSYKRNQTCIMVDGEWVDDPLRVKAEFYNHFSKRFQVPGSARGRLNFLFPNRLS